MIDVHTHVLPGIDDGARNTEMALSMLRESAKQGIKQVIATPHFYAESDTPESFIRRRDAALAKLREATAGENGFPDIISGAEISYFEGIGDCYEVRKLRIEGSKTVLLEMPMIPWNARMKREVWNIFDKMGTVPVIAHIDRYMEAFRDKKIIDYFDEFPVVIQASSDFFVNKKTSALALKLLKKGKIHLIGSDMHNLTTRPQTLREAFGIIDKKLGRKAIEKIERMEAAVLAPTRRYIYAELDLI